MKKSKIAALFILAFLTLSPFSLAEERRGADVVVTKKDGSQVSGELIAVRKDSLLLLAKEPLAGKDLTVALAEINELKIIKKSKAASGPGRGFLLGAGMGAIMGLASGDDAGGIMSFTSLQKAALYGALLGGVGLILGAIAGGGSGKDESISFGGRSEAELRSIQMRLAEFARLKGKIH